MSRLALRMRGRQTEGEGRSKRVPRTRRSAALVSATKQRGGRERRRRRLWQMVERVGEESTSDMHPREERDCVRTWGACKREGREGGREGRKKGRRRRL
ncbi:hypothetical protein B296_00023187, partial [Ensete ventricosum]